VAVKPYRVVLQTTRGTDPANSDTDDDGQTEKEFLPALLCLRPLSSGSLDAVTI
jgi:hypothetical protein